MINSLILEMINYYKGDAKRINHFIKVHSYASVIGRAEGLDEKELFILEAAAVVHDIGIHISEEKYGSAAGKYQEQEGPALAEKLLGRLGFEADVIERVSYLVGHHHTYNNINGRDYQILVEADFLVNIDEDSLSRDAAKAAIDRIFVTKTGKAIADSLFLSERGSSEI